MTGCGKKRELQLFNQYSVDKPPPAVILGRRNVVMDEEFIQSAPWNDDPARAIELTS